MISGPAFGFGFSLGFGRDLSSVGLALLYALFAIYSVLLVTLVSQDFHFSLGLLLSRVLLFVGGIKVVCLASRLLDDNDDTHFLHRGTWWNQ